MLPTTHELASLQRLALAAIADQGLQAPSTQELFHIVHCSLWATSLLQSASLREPIPDELEEFFCEFVVRAVNRAPGIGDAAN
jgi:hypothetical protein